MPLQNNGSAVLEKNLSVKANLCRQGLERTHKNFLAASLNEQKETLCLGFCFQLQIYMDVVNHSKRCTVAKDSRHEST